MFLMIAFAADLMAIVLLVYNGSATLLKSEQEENGRLINFYLALSLVYLIAHVVSMYVL